jgi:acetyl esterase/lipase
VGVAVFSPWADLALTGDSYVSRAEADPFVSKATLKHFADQYLKGTDPTNPAASPLYGLTPRTSIPVRIDVGNHEILFDDSVRYAEKVTRAGLSVSLNIWDGMGHRFQAAIACWEIPPPRSRTSVPFFRAAYYSVSNNSRTDACYHASKQLLL